MGLQEDLMPLLRWESKSKVSSTTELHDFCVGFPGGGLLLSKTQSVFTAHIRDEAGMSPRTVSEVSVIGM